MSVIDFTKCASDLGSLAERAGLRLPLLQLTSTQMKKLQTTQLRDAPLSTLIMLRIQTIDLPVRALLGRFSRLLVNVFPSLDAIQCPDVGDTPHPLQPRPGN